ncbi:hypothetical protein [Bacillus salipaludis]|uniref:hypothetical protein n=1 Tax=Bacillus salipaludis TaxID=2547811 RepID=UPI002E1AD707|nr:hypothetical protein [Bacillus salipaludis]
MKTKTTRNTSVVVILLLVIAVVYWFYPRPLITSTTSEVTIVEKSKDKGEHWIKGYDPNSREKKTIKMDVNEQKIWDSLQEKKTYMLTYESKNNETHVKEIVDVKVK